MAFVLRRLHTSSLENLQILFTVANILFSIYSILYSAKIGMYTSKKAWQITVLHWLASPVVTLQNLFSKRYGFLFPAAWIIISGLLRGSFNVWNLGICFYQGIVGVFYALYSKDRLGDFLIKMNLFVIVGFWFVRLLVFLNYLKPNHLMDPFLQKGIVYLLSNPESRFYFINEVVLHGLIQASVILSQLCVVEITKRLDNVNETTNRHDNVKKDPTLYHQSRSVDLLRTPPKSPTTTSSISRSIRDILYFFISWVGFTQLVSPELMPYPFIPPNPCRIAAAMGAAIVYIF
mmetsp:Transcript_8577/g.9823  ORF Transcript_8577/g.9823 Transcript_8577/m.9823 type:complete len:290 (-) Transcript_8577:193-1062(-)